MILYIIFIRHTGRKQSNNIFLTACSTVIDYCLALFLKVYYLPVSGIMPLVTLCHVMLSDMM